MAKAAAKAAKAPKAARRKAKAADPDAPASPPHSLTWLQGLLCGALVAMAPALAVLLVVLLAPSLLALALERTSGRPVLRSVALCNASGCVAPVRALWAAGHGLAAATALLGDPRLLASAWAAGAAGWLLAELFPFGLRLVLDAAAAAQAARLRARRARLTAEWSLEPPGGGRPG
ncbi:MAG: hypothetical protein HIU82_20640 [Proteobacteria bacterium]|nr:hypothetical protein [Pseudomonadota bacterium]